MQSLQVLAIKRISEDNSYYLIQWWCYKYKLPSNHPLLLKLTWEELYLDYMTDIYASNPKLLEEDKVKMGLKEGEEEWKGNTSEEYEKQVRERLKKTGRVDLSEWQESKIKESDKELEEDIKIEEFDDDFQGN